ncbi:hypothetical protein [Candidatus Palauibacter sp.]|uniref:hypothetical protein n=1 Tax=Candidatus Palauibacter sp. TaxID=3101350 RepID=UPI003D0FD966
MDLKDLMSGMAVVIDDEIGEVATGGDDDEASTGDDDERDLVNEIVAQFEEEWCTPFYRTNEMPPQDTWDNLLQSAGFVLLDWKLWKGNAPELEAFSVERNLRFLRRAKTYAVPVFIFTNENPDDVTYHLEAIYEGESLERSFVFVQRKNELLAERKLRLDAVERWIENNASVYTLKTWDKALREARRDLFGVMYARNPDWPRVFWQEYAKDGVDPSAALTDLINDSLRGRMRTDTFEKEMLERDVEELDVPGEDIHALLGATSFLEMLPEDEVRCGDLFASDDDTFLLNIRPDCDCIPRNGLTVEEVDLYCIEGTIMEPSELRKAYRPGGGYVLERVNQAIVVAAGAGRNVTFSFEKLHIEKFGARKEQRVGRLLHPHVTRIQQRYALYLQRQGLPRIPPQAVPQ